MKRLLLFIVSAVSCLALRADIIDSLLQVYDKEIKRAEVYTSQRQDFIDSLKSIHPMTDTLRLQIARAYQHFQSDSSRAYYLMLSEAEEPVRSEAFIGLLQLLTYSGHFANAFELLANPQRPSIRSVEGYKAVWLLYKEAVTTTLMPQFGATKWEHLALQYYDSLEMALEADKLHTVESRLWLEQYHAQDRADWETAIHYNQLLLNRTTPDEHLYAILSYGHAILYEHAGNPVKRTEWLLRSAITDVRCGITDNGSSWMVAKDCYEKGDIKRASRISNYTLTNASFFNAPTRYVQTYALGHTIGEKYENSLLQDNSNLVIALTALAILLFVLALLVIYSLHQNRRLSVLNGQLSAINDQLTIANQVKEQYLCRYLEVYSDYIRRLTTMARKAGEKDTTAFMNREMENFYRSFDDTFLSLYGSFVEDFNALLKPEARLTPKPGERLTVEMRIFALILLGIDSSAKIAELLCYSPNTISNYRVKVKNNALGNRNDFERQIHALATRNNPT